MVILNLCALSSPAGGGKTPPSLCAKSKRRKERLVAGDAACFSTPIINTVYYKITSFEGDFGKTVVTFILSLFLDITAVCGTFYKNQLTEH